MIKRFLIVLCLPIFILAVAGMSIVGIIDALVWIKTGRLILLEKYIDFLNKFPLKDN